MPKREPCTGSNCRVIKWELLSAMQPSAACLTCGAALSIPQASGEPRPAILLRADAATVTPPASESAGAA